MTHSPGHREHPNHKVHEEYLKQRVVIEVDGTTIADSTDVIEVDETNHPARYYFPRGDVDMQWLTRTDKTTECPFKGTASYFSLARDLPNGDNVAWSYEDPYEEHQALKERIAFDLDKLPGTQVRV